MVTAKRRKYLSLMALFTSVIAILNSCKGKDLVSATPATTPLNVVNASPDTIKYYINGTRQNNTSNLFVGGQTGYVYVISGTQNYKFSDATGNFITFFTRPFTVDTAEYHSLFIAGTTADKAFLLTDPLADAAATLAADTTDSSATPSVIRFINASPDAGNLEVRVGAGDTVHFANRAFGTATNYVPFNSGTKEVKIYTNNGTTLKIDTTITFAASQLYTLFTKGTLNGSGTSLFSVTLTN